MLQRTLHKIKNSKESPNSLKTKSSARFVERQITLQPSVVRDMIPTTKVLIILTYDLVMPPAPLHLLNTFKILLLLFLIRPILFNSIKFLLTHATDSFPVASENMNYQSNARWFMDSGATHHVTSQLGNLQI